MLGFGKKRRVPPVWEEGAAAREEHRILLGHAGRKSERQKPSWSSTWLLLEGIIKKMFLQLR